MKYIHCLGVWVFICLYPKNVKTAKLVKFFVGHQMTAGGGDKFLENSWIFLNAPIRKKNPTAPLNDLKWPTFRVTVKS